MAENRGPQLLAVNIFFSTLAGIIVFLRCYTRIVIVKAFGTDDWIMLVAMVYFLRTLASRQRLTSIGILSGVHHLLEPRRVIRYWAAQK